MTTTNLVVVANGGSATQRAMYSTTVTNSSFTAATLPTFSNGSGTGWQCVAFAPELGTVGRFVTLQNNGIQNNNNDGAYSDDGGATWTGFAMPSSHVWRDICWNGTIFVAVGDGGAVATSSDGHTWTIRTAAQANDWKGVCWSPTAVAGGIFCAVSFNGTNRSMTSPDGITWTATNISATSSRQWNSVCWSPTHGVFLATGFCFGVIATSSDGTTWADTDVSATVSTYQYFKVRWHEQAGEYCMVGGNGGQVAVSSSGTGTWTRTDGAGGMTGQVNSCYWSLTLSKWVACDSAKVVVGDASTWTALTGLPAGMSGFVDIAGPASAPLGLSASPGLGFTMAVAVDDSTYNLGVAGLTPALGLAMGVARLNTYPSRDIRLDWLRRDRMDGSPRFVTDSVPMSEATEAYEVDIKVAGAVVRTFTGLTTNSVVYTAAMQILDGFTQQPEQLTVVVYQMSAAVGRGFGKEVTVNVE